MPNTDSVDRVSQNLIDGNVNVTEYPNITDNAAPTPADIVTRYVWNRLPAVDDNDAYDVRSAGIDPGTGFSPPIVSHTALQAVIDNHPKIFLPKGICQLTGTVTLKPNTIPFGAGQGLTRIEVDPNWNPTVETPIIQTDNSVIATTYLDNLSVGVDVINLANDFFTVLHWESWRQFKGLYRSSLSCE